MTEKRTTESTRDGEASELRIFLIADVCGYTRFTEEHGVEAAAHLASDFADLADDVVEHCHGRVIELRGDEALAVFTSAHDALYAAIEIQSRILEEPRADLKYEVRIGLDAGDAVAVREGYRSGALNRAARLQSIAQPGEVLVSDIVVGLARKIPGLAYVDRGETRLKGLSEPTKVFQVVAENRVPGNVAIFTIEAAPPSNLGEHLTRFVGRERELGEVTDLLRREDVRLLTLTGPGGIGKTRLAMRAAESAASTFRDGTVAVSLASVRDVNAVFPAIAQALQLAELQSEPSTTTVRDYLRDRRFLLVLDNFEQIVEAALQVADLVSSCSKLTVLVTSRVVLHVYGEHEYLVPPMSVPDGTGLNSRDDPMRYESIRLFLDRVVLTQPGFRLTQENAPSIGEICYRLDGLPLAIELAAARIKIFSPQVLLARLDNRLKLLTGGSRNLPLRQQTLRAAIAWSYDLLDEDERVLFRRLSVFVGGCTLEAAEAVCHSGEESDTDVLEGLSSLIDKSLLQRQEGPGPAGQPESRFSMLGTIREFAAAQIGEGEERGALLRRHAEYFLFLASRSYEMLMRAERDPWRAMWQIEWGNLRAMLQWSVETGHPEVTLPVAGYLWVWCWLDGPVEIRDWVDRLLAMPEAQALTIERGWGLGAAALLAWHTGDLERVPELGATAVEIARQCKDHRLLPGALLLAATGDKSARALFEECRALYRQQGNVFGHGFAAVAAVRPLFASGDLELLRDWLKNALADFERTGDTFGQALVLRASGMLAVYSRELRSARICLSEALDRFRSMHEKRYLPLVLLTLGGISRNLGEPARAETDFVEALHFVREYTSGGNLASCIEGLAGVALDRDQTERAALLVGAATRLRAATNSVPFPMSDMLDIDTSDRIARSMDASTFERLHARGYGMSNEDTVAVALATSSADGPPTPFGDKHARL